MIRAAIACAFVALVLLVAACVEESDAGDASIRSAAVLSTLAAAAATPSPEPTPLPPSPTVTHTAEPVATNTPTAEPAATFTPTEVENTATATPVDTPYRDRAAHRRAGRYREGRRNRRRRHWRPDSYWHRPPGPSLPSSR